MRAAIGLLALASAAAAFMLYTAKGRQLKNGLESRAREVVDDARASLDAAVLNRTVTRALEEPHPDTAVARAFEEAAA